MNHTACIFVFNPGTKYYKADKSRVWLVIVIERYMYVELKGKIELKMVTTGEEKDFLSLNPFISNEAKEIIRIFNGYLQATNGRKQSTQNNSSGH